MEEKKISEQESLELISQMINQTKQSLNKGNGNSFLIWGYVCSAVGLLVYTLSMTSIGKNACWLYFAIPVAGGLLEFLAKRKRNSERFVKGYIESMICKCWKALSWVFIITLIVCMTNILLGYHVNLIVFFILGLLLPGIGTAFTGIAIQRKPCSFRRISWERDRTVYHGLHALWSHVHRHIRTSDIRNLLCRHDGYSRTLSELQIYTIEWQ